MAGSYIRLRPVIEAALRRFNARLLIVPGNHDDAALLRAHLLGAEPRTEPLDSVVRVGELRLIGLDSSVPGSAHVRLVLSGIADVFARNGYRGHAGGGFTRVDILDDGEIVTTYVPLTGRDDVLYEVSVDEPETAGDGHGGDGR